MPPSPLADEYKSMRWQREAASVSLPVWRLVQRVWRSRTHFCMERSAPGKAALHDVKAQDW